MNVKNYLIAAVLSAMVLALMFIPMSGSQSSKQYDPWLDYNDDGKISLADLVSLAQSYGTTGDPTKNVIAKSDYYLWKMSNLVLHPGEIIVIENETAGYTQLAIQWMATDTPTGGLVTDLGLQVEFTVGQMSKSVQRPLRRVSGIGHELYSVRGSEVVIWIANEYYSSDIYVEIAVYVVASGNSETINQPEVKKAIEHIVVLDSFSYSSSSDPGAGVTIQPFTSLSSGFYFNFEPKEEFINVSKVYINYICRTTATQVFSIQFYFNYKENIYGTVENSVIARGWTTEGTLSSIKKGINLLDVLYYDQGQTAKLYLYRLELFIEYNYLE